ncbi:dienelactone hydrolase [Macrolepiota fuliginosa MF-IS2]|uniref:Dienelactone hydrolase n=1 Tax=Macrolepiota fuliginosa MF-IS2 TaxID=1400762 RepID=A0A9P5XT83_9AGAR|nr:dienelactone hydrolase [Macrolepiota fuliginosa MF-IS2]
MSTTVHNTNQACCSIPPVQSDYQPKGTIKPLGDFKRVYVTGPPKSENAIVCVYDIFGFFPQTQQGADMLSSALKTTVYMPDFFEPGDPWTFDRFPPKTQGDKDALQKFFGTVASPPANVKKLASFGQALKSEGVQKLGVYGFCWGGKVTMLGSGESTLFNAAAIVHPAMLSVEDAQKITIPFAIYVSKDESIDEYNKILDVVSKKPFAAKNDHKNYSHMFHGWAAARADLKNEDNKQAFDDVYGRLAEFFKKGL